MKRLLRIFQEKMKKMADFLQELADGASYAIHR
ncbi:hypothetical protein SAMN06265376_101129 [Dokdonia pacifica]|uniref:Uncharacterized protein n=1 Tax=Dokdonia pacifica TaxID=1627892 RepID=A0A238VPD2_9FLAO|nr:hypothetical protein SAMN06265376_101129 [Dokdonia pacifica]